MSEKAKLKELKIIRLYINDMTCIECQNRIENALNHFAGIKSAKVNYQTGTAEITYDFKKVSTKKIISVIEELGYSVSLRKATISVSRTVLFLAVIIVLFVLLDYFGILNLLVPSQLADSSMGFGALFFIGLITSIHCIAMCGGINLSQCIPSKTGSGENHSFSESLLPTLLYNLGRVISYTVTGFLLGFVGYFFGRSTDVGISFLFQGILKIIAGVFMIIMGLGMLGLFPALRKLSIRMPKKFGNRIGKAKAQSTQPLIIGLLNGLMPCGPLQSMQIVALASGNPLIGAFSMLMFSLGTVPLMLGFGSLISALGRKFAHAVTTIGSVLVVVLGLALLSQGGNLSGFFSFPVLLVAVVVLSVVGIVSVLPYKKTVQKNICLTLSVCICAIAFITFSLWYPNTAKITDEGNKKVTDGIQNVHSTLQPGSYPDITVQTGIPVKWIIDAPKGSINGCNNRIIIYEYGIEYSFKTGENIIEFTPDKTGIFSYSCWMGMIHGNICVTE